MVKKLFFNTLLSIFIISATSSAFACLDNSHFEEREKTSKKTLPKLPSQDEQISAYLSFVQYPKDETLFKITQTNFEHIENIICTRFGKDSDRYKEFVKISEECQGNFSTRKVSLKGLAKVYFRLVTLLDPKSYRTESYVNSKLKTIDTNFLSPIPVVSRQGLGSISKISDFISEGYCYLGIPLNENVHYDGYQCSPQKFVEHDLFHAEYLTVNPETTQKTFGYLQRFNQDLKPFTDGDFLNIIRHNSYHESTGPTLFTLLAEPSEKNPLELLSYEEFVVRILNEGRLKTLRPGERGNNGASYVFAKEFIPYIEKKGIMKFPETMNLDQKIFEFIDKFNSRIDNLISHFALEETTN